MTEGSDSGRAANVARKLVERLEADPATMAWIIAQYREAEGCNDELVAAALGMSAEMLPRLALCNRPRREQFSDDIQAIAEHTGVDSDRLAVIVRHVDALAAFGRLRRRVSTFEPSELIRAAEESADYYSEDPLQTDDADDQRDHAPKPVSPGPNPVSG